MSIRKSGENSPWYLYAAQVLLALVAIAAAIFHAFPLERHIEHENYPVLDVTTIAWIGIFIIAMLLPQISEITLGGASLKLREVKESAKELTATLEDIANLLQNWSTSSVLYIYLLEKAEDDSARAKLLRNYLRDRIGESRAWMSDDPDDDVRIALWIFNPASKKLEFYFSNNFRPTQESYDPGEGMIGQAFLEARQFNEPDVRAMPTYKATRAVDPPYRAVLCCPVLVGDEKIGMLTADKREAEIFGEVADEIARGLAAQCALAIDQFRRAG
jgi:GAF domain-containing protein